MSGFEPGISGVGSDRSYQLSHNHCPTEQFGLTFFHLQLSELASLRTDLKQLMGIARQLEPYIRSITTVMERIQPEVRSTAGPPIEDQHFAEPETEKAHSSSLKRQQQQQLQQQQQQQQQHKTPVNYPVSRPHQVSAVRQSEFDREQIQIMAAAAVAAMHAVKAQEAASISISSPPSDAPTPLPPPMPAMVASSSPCARSSPYDRQTPYRPSSREGRISNHSS